MIRSSACQPWQPDRPGHAGDRGGLLSYTTPRDTIPGWAAPELSTCSALHPTSAEHRSLGEHPEVGEAVLQLTFLANLGVTCGTALLHSVNLSEVGQGNATGPARFPAKLPAAGYSAPTLMW